MHLSGNEEHSIRVIRVTRVFMKGCMTRREKESAPLWSVHQNCSTDNVQITLLVAGSGVKSQAGNKGRSGHATPSSLHLFQKGD
jgi:hypothetical protein